MFRVSDMLVYYALGMLEQNIEKSGRRYRKKGAYKAHRQIVFVAIPA